MEAVFSNFLDMSLTASYVIVALLLIRLLLKKAPKKYSYALWLVAAFRLVCPVSIESAFSLFNLNFSLGKTVGVTLRDVPEHSISKYIPPVQNVTTPPAYTPDLAPSPTPGMIENIPVTPSAPALTEPAVTLMGVLSVIWCMGIAALLIYSVVTYIKLKRQMSTAVLLDGNIRQAAGIRSPFILGFIRPQIYIPYHLSQSELSYVLAHERYHLRRFDHIIKPLAFLILAVHWFNPLVWLAFHLMVKDMEMSCDEKVLSRDESIRKDYSSTLLSFAAGRAFPSPSPLSFGEGSVKSRIKNILNWKKPALWLTIAAIVICIVVIAVCGTNPQALLSLNDVESVYADGETMSVNAKAELITLINSHRKTTYRKYPETVGFADSRAVINCADGSSYWVHYWYCSGFSFNPAHYGEDDYYTILSRLDAEGNVEKSWKMEYDFDKEFLSWLEVHSVENIYPFDCEFSLSEAIFTRDNGSSMAFEAAEAIRLERGGAFYADGELLGTFEQWSLTENNWDNCLTGTSGTWLAYSAKELRRNNFRTWRSVSGDRLHYLLLQEDGTLYLADGYYDSEGEYDAYSDDSNIKNVWSLNAVTADTTIPDDIFVPISCLYMAPHSSFYPWGGDSGCRYIIGSDSFTVERVDGSGSEIYPIDRWNYSILSPYSAQWTEMFIGDAPAFDNIGKPLYLQISDEYFLLNLDGQLHVGEISGDYVWAIYAVVPEAQLGSAVWEYRPEFSSRAPWFEFEFDMEYDNLQISTSVGTLFSDGSRYADTQLDLPVGSTVRWSPSAQYGRYSGTQLQFTINFANGSMIQGTIYISSEDNTLYTATLHANGLYLSNDEEYGHAVITATIPGEPEGTPDDIRYFTTDLSELLNKWQAEGIAELSSHQIEQLNRNFIPTTSYGEVNPISSFFQCYYERPEDINLAEFLRYNGLERVDYTEEDFSALKQLDPPVGPLISSETYEDAIKYRSPIHKFPREMVDALLTKYAAVTTAELTSITSPNTGLVYIAASDAYFNFTSDMAAGAFSADSGEIVDDTAYLYSGFATLTLRKSGDVWLIYSHTYDSEAAAIAYLANGILEIFDAGGEMTMTSYAGKDDKGAALTITDRATAERYSRMLQSCHFTKVDAPAEEPDVPRIEFTPSSPINRLIIWDSETPLLRYSPRGRHEYYTFTLDAWGNLHDELYKSHDGRLQQEYLESRRVYATDLNELLNQWHAEGVKELSKEQAALVDKNFIAVAWNENGIGIASVNPLTSFFQCYYDRPEDIDLAEFLRYNALTPAEVGSTEFNALKRHPEFSSMFPNVNALSDMPVPVNKYPADEVDALLKEYAGITTDALTDEAKSGIIYLERFDAYYNFTSDFAAGTFNCSGGEFDGDTLRLYSGYATLTLRKSGDVWLIYSHTYNSAAQLNDALPDIPLSHFDYNGKLLITAYSANQGARETITVTDRTVAERISAAMAGCSYTELEMPLTAPSDFWIVLEPGVRVNKTTLWSGASGTSDMIQHSPRGEHSYYSISAPTGYSLATAVLQIYDGLIALRDAQATQQGFEAESPEAAVEAYCAAINAAPITNSNIIDRKIIEYDTVTVREDGKAVLGWQHTAVLPVEYDVLELWAGNADYGTGEYAEWIVSSSEFVLKLGYDGLWYCTSTGTSCANALP